MYVWIDTDVKKNIQTVTELYPGSAEDALIAYLQDEGNVTNDRTHIAIWTMGQIRSEKAIPILYKLHANDPEGETCFGKHDSLLCQYEIFKAIGKIENGKLFSYARYHK